MKYSDYSTYFKMILIIKKLAATIQIPSRTH